MLDYTTTLEHMKQKIYSMSGVPLQEQRLFFKQKLITSTAALHKVNDGGNILLNLKMRGGAGECDSYMLLTR